VAEDEEDEEDTEGTDVLAAGVAVDADCVSAGVVAVEGLAPTPLTG
jgi:hypothetical protein